MSAETKKVLEMLAEGKITADDAEQLLDKLAATSTVERNHEAATAFGATVTERPAVLKFLRVVIDPGEGEKNRVNVKVPLSFLRSGVKFLGMLPPKVAEKLNHKGIDFDFLSSLRGEELNAALNALHVDIDTEEGQHVKVFCE